MNTLLQDPLLQKQLEKDGFVIVPFLNAEEIQSLQKLFDDTRPEVVEGIYSNVYNGGKREQNLHIDNTIEETFQPYFDQYFQECYMAACTYLVKGNNAESESQIHQDWNNVDETQGVSLSIWVPLVDVDEHNGCLQVIPGSHNFFQTQRAITIPSIFMQFDDELNQYLQAVPMKAGEACIYAHNLFHGSKPNKSGQVRVSAVSGILPNGSKHIHYYKGEYTPENKVEVYEIDRYFYLDHLFNLINGQRPTQLMKIDEVDCLPMPVTREQIFAKAKIVNPIQNSSEASVVVRETSTQNSAGFFGKIKNAIFGS